MNIGTRYPAPLGLHVCDVSFAVFGMVDNFLALSGKLVFPSAVPFRFILPPRIAKPTSFVSPVPNASFSALGNHGTSAETTLARKIGLSFLALSVYESKFHAGPGLCLAHEQSLCSVMVERRDSGTRSYWRVAVTASVIMIGASDRA